MSKIRKLSKNCSVKRELLLIENSSAEYRLWFECSWNYKKNPSAVVMRIIEKVFILFLRIIHTDLRSSHLEPWTLRRLHWISFLKKIAYLRTAFLHYTSRYISVWINRKTIKLFKKILLFTLWVAACKTSENFWNSRR